MDTLRASAVEQVKSYLDAEVEITAGQTFVKKSREMKIYREQQCFTCIIEHDISFGKVNADGTALNRAEIFLLPEEYPSFLFAWKNFRIPLPTDYRQWQQVNPHIVSMCMESVEAPEDFAARLSAAFSTLKT
ncbi:hypothetical protein [Planococcus alpniumensis]|uniref:hypothetical protein n=1 Tax=Planococcus alpniumensis TaxID=2708345 RepID=UPI001B8CF44E|nr:hypothetical protein [Planococcus sp. MSAK28401]